MVSEVKIKNRVSQRADRTSDLALAALFSPEMDDSRPNETRVRQMTPPKPILLLGWMENRYQWDSYMSEELEA